MTLLPATSSTDSSSALVGGVVASIPVDPSPAARGVAGGERPREELSAGAAERIRESLASSTRTVYEREWAGWVRWCYLTGHQPLPASAEALANYLDHLSRQPTRRGTPPAPGTLDKVLGALQAVHKLAGAPADTRLARLVLRTYRREHAKARRAESLPVRRQSLPIGDRLVGVLIASLLKAEEEQALPAVRVRRDQCALLHSKTDQDADGSIHHLPNRSNAATCPVRVTRAWIAALDKQRITSGPLLRGVDRSGRIAGTAEYAGPKHVGRLSDQALNDLLRTALDLADKDESNGFVLADPRRYSWHGLRAGFATTAARNNTAPETIARHVRWTSVATVMRYWRDGDDQVNTPVAKFDL
ncbi:hypothetical protein EBO15_16720 [Actinomadura harenae]|uniref:Integrase n=1 Tax=Actinomadura harenae TaxID=2483351 RepID=A0A3M2M3D7_9ACTN|nr:hypothetical protein EBO15_16720 [Actinomadura harenae]